LIASDHAHLNARIAPWQRPNSDVRHSFFHSIAGYYRGKERLDYQDEDSGIV
jgi:hypothetical protein